MKNYKFYIDGMHCKACVALVESELHGVLGIKNIKVSLDSNDLELSADFGEQSNSEIAEKLTKILKPHGYFVSADSFYNKELDTPKKVNWSDFKVAIPVALVFIALFITLQKLGIVNLVTSSKVTYG
ncbi:MAG: heavy-metal-associated domain-containing protein, partial [bacterium]|nr:heavy-metal-associated domain-containing protein [bacterium]